MGRLSVFGILALVIAGCRCNGSGTTSPPIPDGDNIEDTLTPIRERPNSSSAIIFVHGLCGNATQTWTNSATKTFWPKLICGDPAFDRFDVYTFGYSTDYVHTTSRIYEVGENLRLRLDSPKFKQKELVLVAHSMGGNVVRSFMLNNHDMADQVKLIAFYATPTDGSDLANLAAIFSGNEQIREIASSGNDWLDSQKIAWLDARFKARSYAAYETVPTLGRLVVDRNSALALADHADPISRNHIEIVKPKSRDDTPYVVLKNAIDTIIPEDLRKANKEPPTSDAAAEMERNLLTKDKALKLNNGKRQKIQKPNDSEIVLNNSTGIDIYLLIYDCTFPYNDKKQAGDLPWVCKRLHDGDSLNGDTFSEFRDPSGWFLFFRRFVNSQTGGIDDRFLGAFDIYNKQFSKLMLVNGEQTDSIELVANEKSRQAK